MVNGIANRLLLLRCYGDFVVRYEKKTSYTLKYRYYCLYTHNYMSGWMPFGFHNLYSSRISLKQSYKIENDNGKWKLYVERCLPLYPPHFDHCVYIVLVHCTLYSILIYYKNCIHSF